MSVKRISVLSMFVIQLSAQVIAIKAGFIVDPATATIKQNQIILIEQQKIKTIGSSIDLTQAQQVIDLSNSYVMPGLMDAHAHLSFGIPPYYKTNPDWEMYFLKESSAYRALRGMKKAIEALESGFTTIKDIGNDANYAMIDVRKAIETGYFVGPTLLNSGKIIAAFGGQSKGFSPEQGPFWQFEYIDADTPDEIRKAVRVNLYYGATTIKLVADNDRFFYSEEELKAGVDEAHRAGVTISIHVYGGQAATNVINARPESIEHGTNLTDKQMEDMKDRGIFLVGTDFPEEHLKAMGSSDQRAKKTAKDVVDRLRRADKIGVKMAFGTDVILDLPGKTRGQMNLDYLDVWQAAGVSSAKILKCMTTNAAELMAIQNERGALKQGLFADIIASPDNPLSDIQTLKQVHFVMKDGKVVKQN
ncbi:MAG: amidohydrolase family protein [Calditrichaeota bacterium]|nr:amidohydrolase family protein [Calditrichota bacterium]